jgi:hypothetical protein
VAQPLVAAAQRDDHVLVAGQVVQPLRGGRGHLLDEAERREDATRFGLRLGDLGGRLGVADQGGAGGHLQAAVEVDVGGADHDRRVGGGAALLVAAEQRERGAVVAAALALVLLDQPAGVLDR